LFSSLIGQLNGVYGLYSQRLVILNVLVAFGVTFLGYKMEPDWEALLIQLRALHFENPDQQVVIHGFNRVEGIELTG